MVSMENRKIKSGLERKFSKTTRSLSRVSGTAHQVTTEAKNILAAQRVIGKVLLFTAAMAWGNSLGNAEARRDSALQNAADEADDLPFAKASWNKMARDAQDDMQQAARRGTEDN